MDLSDRHRHLLLVEQGLHAFLINVVLNALIAWLLLRSHDAIALWGETSIGIDLLATAFLLPFLTCQIVSRVITAQISSGKLPPLDPEDSPARGWHRRSISTRALVAALAAVVFGAAPLVWLLDLAQAQPVPLLSFVAFKAAWAGLLAALITPVIAWWALAAASATQPSTASG